MLQASLLGQFTVQVDGRPVTLSSRPAQALLAYLLLNPNLAHPRSQLAGLLWPDSDESTARKNLRNAVWQLRKVLDERFIGVSKETIAFHASEAYELDIARLGAGNGGGAIEALIKAVSVYQGDLLPGFYEDWVDLARERLRALFERRMQQLLDKLTAAERWPETLHWAEHWIALGHVPEPAYRALMLAHAAWGDLAGMAAAYQRCVQALETELAVRPSPETRSLYERLSRPSVVAPAPPAPAGRYQRGKLLAVGGQGELYEGRDVATGQPVVIKRLLPALIANDAEAVARFTREGELLCQLDHPNIVKMLALVEQADGHSLVMEYMPGGTLRDLLDQRPQLPLERVLAIGLELADALARAHHLGIVHRDVKPENVLLAADGTPRLTDFGLARLLRDDLRLTQAGTPLGTPAYMSPEALRGEELDARSDIWSLGILLYEMLAGRSPFEGSQLPPVVAGILHEPAPDLKQFRPDVPPALARLLGQLLVKDRAGRVGSMRQVAAELEAIRAGRHQPAGGPEATPREAPARPIQHSAAMDLTTPPAWAAQQQIRFCITPDRVRLAYATLGAGPVLVKAGNPLTHLEFDLHSPVWGHWWKALAHDHTLVRYDERGCGLSDWHVPDQSMEAWTSDLETVVDQLGPEPFVLLGLSQGAAVAIAYAARHPERVSHLILYGGYARGRHRRAQTPEQHDEAHTLVEVMRLGWGKNNPAFRQVFATLFMPDATIEQLRWYTELARVTTSPENAAAMEMAFYEIDVADLAPQVTTPTLVLHARGDAMCPFEEGRLMATLIPGARLVPLDSNNHILLEHEPAWTQFLSEVRRFITPAGKAAVEPPTQTTSPQAEPAHPPAAREQHIRFCQAADGVRLAYATVGDGPPLVKAANWLSHLEYDWISPIWRHWMLGLAETHTLVRYDERGCGLSDWEVDDLTFEAWVRDLETVVDASGVERFPLLGISQGGPIAIAYTLRHPERVSHLVLYGSYARGRRARESTAQEMKEHEALLSLVGSGWGRENPAFRQVFTSYFIPGGTFEQFHWFNDLQRVSASPENAARMIQEFDKIDVRSLAPQLSTPTLVLHAVHDARIPFKEGRLVATLIPGARFVPLDSRNHILLEGEPAFQRFLTEVRQFLATPGA